MRIGKLKNQPFFTMDKKSNKREEICGPLYYPHSFSCQIVLEQGETKLQKLQFARPIGYLQDGILRSL
jgi:hypothetical protein